MKLAQNMSHALLADGRMPSVELLLDQSWSHVVATEDKGQKESATSCKAYYLPNMLAARAKAGIKTVLLGRDLAKLRALPEYREPWQDE